MSGIRLAVLLFLIVCLPVYSSVPEIPLPLEPDKIHIARLQYTGIHDYTSIKNWYTDYPHMDENLTKLVNRLTGIRTAVAKTPITQDIFNYPLIYIVEPGQISAGDGDITILREYFNRGGFAVFDDIHGDEDFEPVTRFLAKVFPGGDALVPLKTSHPLFHNFFDIGEIVQATHNGIAMCKTCEQWENGPSGEIPAVYVHSNAVGDINAVIFHNNDLGDACEWLDDPNYPRQMAIFAVKMLTNTFLWGLTH